VQAVRGAGGAGCRRCGVQAVRGAGGAGCRRCGVQAARGVGGVGCRRCGVRASASGSAQCIARLAALLIRSAAHAGDHGLHHRRARHPDHHHSLHELLLHHARALPSLAPFAPSTTPSADAAARCTWANVIPGLRLPGAGASQTLERRSCKGGGSGRGALTHTSHTVSWR